MKVERKEWSMDKTVRLSSVIYKIDERLKVCEDNLHLWENGYLDKTVLEVDEKWKVIWELRAVRDALTSLKKELL